MVWSWYYKGSCLETLYLGAGGPGSFFSREAVESKKWKLLPSVFSLCATRGKWVTPAPAAGAPLARNSAGWFLQTHISIHKAVWGQAVEQHAWLLKPVLLMY